MNGIPIIPAADWNAHRRIHRASRAKPGRGIRLFWTSEGIVATYDLSDLYKHPWSLTPRWRADESLSTGGQWVATVHPGFVNGYDVTIGVTEQVNGDEVTNHRPLTAEQPPEIVLNSFRNPLAAGGASIDDNGDVILAAGEGYPRFFEELGVKPAEGATNLTGSPTSSAAEPSDATRTRQIRVCELVLISPRFATRQEVSLRDPFTEAATVEISTTFLNGRIASAPSLNYLVTVSKFNPISAPTALERLAGTAVETEQDQLLIATVYFVSPPETPDDAAVDGTWEPYPVYRVFWNLAHASLANFGQPSQPPLSLHLGLAFGIGDALFNFLLSPINDLLEQVQAFLGAADSTGLYWTPGALGNNGGTASVVASPSPQTTGPRLGFNPAAYRIAREEKAKVDAVVPPLNPQFPFRRALFDPEFFGLFDEVPEAGV